MEAKDLNVVVKYIEEKSKEMIKYSDVLRDNVKEIDYALTPMFEDAGVRYEQNKPFYSINNELERVGYYLAIRKSGQGNWGIYIDQAEYSTFWIGDASREVLKAAVKALPEFISMYSEYLKTKTEEFREASEIATVLNEAIIAYRRQ